MPAPRSTALIDACVLAGALTRNIVLSLAEAGLFRPCWSEDILSEAERAIGAILRAKGDPEPEARARRSREALAKAFPEAAVEDYESLIPRLVLPDPDDRHVLAAALRARAATIVTDNAKDFPRASLEGLPVRAVTTDRFVADLLALDRPAALVAIRTMRLRFRRPELDAGTLLLRMDGAGLRDAAKALMPEIGSL